MLLSFPTSPRWASKEEGRLGWRRLEVELTAGRAVMDVSIKETESRSVTDISISELLRLGDSDGAEEELQLIPAVPSLTAERSGCFPSSCGASAASTFSAQPFINNNNNINS